MKGPIKLMRSHKIEGCENKGPLYEWQEGNAYLITDKVSFRGKTGALLCYYNPPVHQVGNPGVDAYLKGLEEVFQSRHGLDFLVLCGANDPVHAGGDLKESLNRLDETLTLKKEKVAAGASAQEIDRLFDWADSRLEKGIALHGIIRKIAQHLRVIAVCGGGTRFGGSAEIPLMADYLVGDSRSGMCFSEAMIGLIPGWSGIARTLVKAGFTNTQYMAMASKEVKSAELKMIGVYNEVVDVPFSFPKRQKTHDPEADKTAYLQALGEHNDRTGMLLMPKALEIATCAEEEIPGLGDTRRPALATKEEVFQEVERRKNPENYSGLWGKPLKEVGEEMKKMGRPLAPQSVEGITELLRDYDPSAFEEIFFVKKEMEADARLYRDPRFRAGLIATLEQRVADYRL
jgi:enoyl-CoA hydratase/carnithine racemase